MTQCCSTTAKECRDQLKINLFSTQLLNEKSAYKVIRSHSKMVAQAFNNMQEEK